MCMLLGMSKQLVYAFPGFYNKETIYSNILKIASLMNKDLIKLICLIKAVSSFESPTQKPTNNHMLQ